MMTKWDTIQEDVKDAYVWMDEELAIEESESEYSPDEIAFIKALSLDELAEQELALDWEDSE